MSIGRASAPHRDLAARMRTRRGALTTREAAEQVGIAYATFVRLEAGGRADVETFELLREWLGAGCPAVDDAPDLAADPLERAIACLSEDPKLTSAASDAIAETLRRLYEAHTS